ncbi:MAG: hypothetical protein J6A06_08340 [Fibrobacteraceae bacterium]|nr:hypothetical protein [Fibrobacteraceae bacterium]
MNKKLLFFAMSIFFALFAAGCSDSNSSSADEEITDICTEDPNAPGCVPEPEPEPDLEEI